MARVNGPLMSMSASGALAGTIVFSHWKGRPYVRQLVKPANPRSGGQTSMRAMMKFLSQQWSGLNPAAKATWEDLADAGVFSPFNAFTKTNLKRNRDFLAASQGYPVDPQGDVDAIDTFTATPGVRSVTIVLNTVAVVNTTWAFLLYMSTTTLFTPSFTNLIAVIPADGITEVSFVHSPLEPDTYYYDAKPFHLDASIGALKGEINGVVS